MVSRVEVADGDQLYRIKDRCLVIVGKPYSVPALTPFAQAA